MNECRVEIGYIDPETYVSVVNHDLRKRILVALYRKSLDRPISKEEIAGEIGSGYHQVVYQLNNHLMSFWTVIEEKKVRGTRMELIAPSHPNAILIAFGRDNTIFMVDPIANLFGSVSKVGTRCDICTEEEAKACMRHVTACDCARNPTAEQVKVLRMNNRKLPLRPLDHAMLCALEGVSKGESCVISIPCASCAFRRRVLGRTEGLVRIEGQVDVGKL
ncbi:MAG: hypothetical protein FJ151_00165 [Euryarchaeota archaeon]|nr:hypothetical protein [Euryarchaeota archaeon]